MDLTPFNIREHKVVSIILFIVAFIIYLPYVQEKECFQFVDSYRWMLYDDSAWSELAPTLSLIERGEILWGYLYHDITQRAHSFFVIPLLMAPVIKLFGLYPGIPIVHVLFLVMNSFCPVFIYAISFKVFNSRNAAFVSGLLIATEPFIAQNATYISRHPPSIFFFALSIFLITVFLGRPKKSIGLSVLMGLSLGVSCFADGDGLGLVAALAVAVIILQVKRLGKGLQLHIDRKLTYHAILVTMIAVSIYSTAIIRNYRNLGMVAPNWTTSKQLAASNNHKIAEVAKKGGSLFCEEERLIDWEYGKKVYRPEIDRKLAMNIYPEYEYYMMYATFFKRWVKEHPLDFINIYARRFYQNITTYYSWHSTAIALSALMGIFFLRPFIGRSFHLLIIWFASSSMFCLIYLTFWHQMHQVMVLSIFSGFGILKLSNTIDTCAGKITEQLKPRTQETVYLKLFNFLARVPGKESVSVFLVIIILINVSYITKIYFMMDPKTRHSTKFNNYKPPFAPDNRFKNDYLAIREGLPENTLLVTQLNPFIVNKLTRRDVLLSKLGYMFDPYAPKGLQNGWLITTPEHGIYRFREHADYVKKAADYVRDTLASGRTVISDFNPNIDKLRFQAEEIFPGHTIEYYKLDTIDETIHIDNRWRDAYGSSGLLTHPNVEEIKGTVHTSNPDYIFSIIDNTESYVTFSFPVSQNKTVRKASLFISTYVSSPVERCVQVSSDNKKWIDVSIHADSGYKNTSIVLPSLQFKDKIYIKIFQETFSNMHLINIDIGIK